jgi:hypothetical protein
VVLGGQEDYQAITYLGDTWLYGVPGSLTQTSNTVYDVTQGQIAFDLSLEGASVAVSGAAGAVTYTQSTGAAFVSVSSTGAISAVASTPPGDYFVSGTDTDGAGDSGAWSFQLQVAAAPVLILPGGSVLPGSTVGDSYSQQFTAQLSQGPFTWSVTAGSLPTGLSLSSSGLLSGTTTKEGNYSFTITATASEGYGASVATSIAVAPASLTVDPSSLPGATSGDPYTTTLSLKGGGALPAGLVLSSTGVISGTPTSSGSSSFSIVATDGDGFSTTKGYSMLVEAPGA